ncbi:MAG: terminase family protein [Gammaproteobacteria bacterium]|nr:terminase family protein [Gammaproteobacteria bacterium]
MTNHSTVKISEREQARLMYWRGYTMAEISRLLDVQYKKIHNWKNTYQWDNTPVAEKVAAQTEYRLSQLIAKEDKSDKDFNEIEALGKLLERTARIEKYSKTEKESDLNPNINNRNKARKKKQKEKHSSCIFNQEQIEKLEIAFRKRLYPHQQEWYKHSIKYFMRQYIKSRQIGATYYFAMEALITALKTGKNQIFMSASKNQAHVFKTNIINFVDEVLGVQLKGDPIKLGAGTMLYFLGNNTNTAQSYSGDLYIDEYFWIPSFEKIQHVASGMAMHDDRRVTYFSTPSATTHEAYPLWTGEHFNIGRPKDEHIKLNVSHDNLKDGKLCKDGYFRQLITIKDAIDKGFDLVTMEKLKLKFPPLRFTNLLMCKFVDGANSIFSMQELMKNMVDSIEKWKDFRPFDPRPLGDAPVWIGYDPSRTGDNSSLVIVSPPTVVGGKFRILERESFNGLDFDEQAAKIKAYTQKYNVQHIAIDTTGIGIAVYDQVRKFFKTATKIHYNIEEKNQMVLKAKQLFSHGLLQFDSQHVDIAQAFLTIHQTGTASGKGVTYKTSRTVKTGHGDLAWATMHAIIQDPLGAINEVGQGRKTATVMSF